MLDHNCPSSVSAAHPIGTTIRVHSFLKSLPVRKQSAMKSAGKTLGTIKKLLFAYAFARPGVRFNLKVRKGKTDKLNWTYAPSSTKSLMEVAAKVVGAEIASHCLEQTISLEEEPRWSIHAVLVSVGRGES